MLSAKQEVVATDTVKQDARTILKMLVDKGLQAGEALQNTMIQSYALALGLDGDRLDKALIFAVDEGWIEDGPPGATRLTKTGYAAATES
jgi:hypothetical protein